MTIRPDTYGRTDTGKVRHGNEDQFLIAELSKWMEVQQTSLPIADSTRLTSQRTGYLYLVADGMGGAPAGERASLLAVESVVRTVLNVMPWCFRVDQRDEDVEEELKKILEKCQTKIEADVSLHPSRSGMGTTLTMAYVIWPDLYVVHVGDARAYLFRKGQLTQITKDHTLANALGSAVTAPRIRKVLWNVIGGSSSELRPDVYHLTLEAEDMLLLATDGLSRHLSDERIGVLLRAAPSAKSGCSSLIDETNAAGGKDNVTTVLARFAGKPSLADTSAVVAKISAADTTQPLPLPPLS